MYQLNQCNDIARKINFSIIEFIRREVLLHRMNSTIQIKIPNALHNQAKIPESYSNQP